ncbi:MAG: hypothetical protein WAX66_02345 [Patescibacteria group bacterium]
MEEKETSKTITIHSVEKYSVDVLIDKLRDITMLKDATTKPYKDSFISLEKISIEGISPAQRYVLSYQLLFLRELKWELEKFDIDMFDLNGFVRMNIEGESEPIDLLPPVVEESIERTGHVVNLINDGMHRLYIAQLEWLIPKVIFIRGIPKSLPYYSFPIPRQNWDTVRLVEDIPESFIKKWHRIKDNKILYRNFESTFKNVGQPRGNFALKN